MPEPSISGQGAASVTDIPLVTIAENAVMEYGGHVIANRALVDYRDGLKPVHRRILWVMHRLGLRPNSSFRKCAKIVGDTLGEFHPHGDSAIYESLVTLANMPKSFIIKQGNFGNPFGGDGAAAQRYTEAKLSKYASEQILPLDYLNVIPKHSTYDDKNEEPLYLPALVPNLLLNGTYGIALGATGIIPPFEKKGVVKLTRLAMKGKKITPRMCAKHLRVDYSQGGHCVSPEDKLLDFYSTGKGALKLRVDYELDKKAKTIVITGAPFGITKEKIVKSLTDHPKLAEPPKDLSNKDRDVYLAIKLKRTISELEIEKVAEEILSKIDFSLSASVSVTKRLKDGAKADFEETNIPNFIHKWVEYRIDLEKRYQQYLIDTADNKTADLNLMKVAASNRKIIMKALDENDPAFYISTKLKLTLEQANRILDLAIRRLSKLSEKDLDKQIKELKEKRLQAEKLKANPVPRIIGMMESA